MDRSSQADFLCDRFFSKLPPETVAQLTENQVKEMRQAFQGLSWKAHPIDIRFTAPVPGLRFYVVFLAGPDRRSRRRSHEDVWKLANVAASLAFWVFLVLASIGAVHLFLPVIPFLRSGEFHPTAIPWLKDKVSCEESGSIWQDGECWNEEFNPNF
ncbi:MAG: hypothetical protein F6K19_50850 [Cyanothece sp. SIO1E1]|nr:hypothetical protein [Cyanothece sp. SIO1E1]